MEVEVDEKAIPSNGEGTWNVPQHLSRSNSEDYRHHSYFKRTQKSSGGYKRDGIGVLFLELDQLESGLDLMRTYSTH
jgi:hypothetical protein